MGCTLCWPWPSCCSRAPDIIISTLQLSRIPLDRLHHCQFGPGASGRPAALLYSPSLLTNLRFSELSSTVVLSCRPVLHLSVMRYLSRRYCLFCMCPSPKTVLTRLRFVVWTIKAWMGRFNFASQNQFGARLPDGPLVKGCRPACRWGSNHHLAAHMHVPY